MGMSTVPLSELYGGAAEFLAPARFGGSVSIRNIERAEWDEETSQWTLATRHGRAGFGFSG